MQSLQRRSNKRQRIYVVEVDLMGVKYYQIITHVTYKEKS